MEWLLRQNGIPIFIVLRVVLLILLQQCPVDGFTMKGNIDAPFQTTTTTMIHPLVQRRLPRFVGNRPHRKDDILPSHIIMCLSKDSSTHTKEEVESTTLINGQDNNPSTTAAAITTISRTTSPQEEVKIVVVMNANARGVSASTIRIAQEVFGTASVYVTHTIPQVHRALEQILLVQPPPPPPPPPRDSLPRNLVVVTMGGDGTLATTIQTMCQILLPPHPTREPGAYTSVMSQLPTIAYVPLGTGNAVGSVVGCSDHYHPAPSTPPATSIYDRLRRRIPFLRRRGTLPTTTPIESSRSLRRLQATLRHIQETIHQHNNNNNNPTPLSVVELPMMEISNTNFSEVCFFAGGTFFKIVLAIVLTLSVCLNFTNPQNHDHDSTLCVLCLSIFKNAAGFDSLMLNDFKEIKEWSERSGFLSGMLSSVVGYCVTLLVKTLPKTVLRSSHMVNVQVTANQINNTYWVDHRRGDFVQPCNSPILYSGTTGIIAGSTVPYYGGKLRLFPFARISSDKLHLRIGRIHPLVGFFNIPKIFAGTYRDFSKTRFGVLDFIGNDFTITVSPGNKDAATNGFPLQHSGESIGAVSNFRLRVIDAPVRFLNLLPDR